jgi:hypothetical protein
VRALRDDINGSRRHKWLEPPELPLHSIRMVDLHNYIKHHRCSCEEPPTVLSANDWNALRYELSPCVSCTTPKPLHQASTCWGPTRNGSMHECRVCWSAHLLYRNEIASRLKYEVISTSIKKILLHVRIKGWPWWVCPLEADRTGGCCTGSWWVSQCTTSRRTRVDEEGGTRSVLNLGQPLTKPDRGLSRWLLEHGNSSSSTQVCCLPPCWRWHMRTSLWHCRHSKHGYCWTWCNRTATEGIPLGIERCCTHWCPQLI